MKAEKKERGILYPLKSAGKVEKKKEMKGDKERKHLVSRNRSAGNMGTWNMEGEGEM